jgi:hypothetical protein
MVQISRENTYYSIFNLTTIMQKKFNAQILASVKQLSDYEQSQIRGGANLACGCGDEKRKSVKVKKTPVIKSKLMGEQLGVCDCEENSTEDKPNTSLVIKSIKTL